MRRVLAALTAAGLALVVGSGPAAAAQPIGEPEFVCVEEYVMLLGIKKIHIDWHCYPA